ncbi:MAG: M23 family metallopeptidase [Myxococcaceae bacterium]|nr:M23 family metallopeptidase [Myxococcaceae bacterium]
MLRLASLSVLALLAACATPRSEGKVSFEEAFAPRSEAPAPEAAAAPAPVRLKRKPRTITAPGKELPTARTSPELQAALTAFVNRARAYRRQVERGSPMPAEQVKNWEGVNGSLEAFLSRPAEKTSALDIVRARVTLEAELEEDARLYGDIPQALAETVMTQVGELTARMSDVRRLMVQTIRQVPRFTWPIAPVSVTSHFGAREHPILGEARDHLGVDLAARRGQAVAASAAGVVLNAGWNGNHGYQVEIQHAPRVFTRYSHLSRVLVAPGEIVERGDVVGLAGDTGLATGVHLHFELWKDGRPKDPLDEVREDDGVVELGPVSAQEAPRAGNAKGRRPVGRRP